MKKILFLFILAAIQSCIPYMDPRFAYDGVNVHFVTSQHGRNQLTESPSQSASTFGIQAHFGISDQTSEDEYLYSPARNNLEYVNPILTMKITANKNFDAEHPAGSLLNDLFYYHPGALAQIEDLASDGTAPEFTPYNYPNYPDVYFPYYADFMLKKSPSVPIDVRFVVSFSTTEETFTDSTDLVHLY